MTTRYFVTQERGSSAHVAASMMSDPYIIALSNRLTLYEGDRDDVALGVARNLRSGMLNIYDHDPESGTLVVTRREFEDGTLHYEWSALHLPDSIAIQGLEQEAASSFEGRGDRLTFFGRFSPEEIN